MSSVFCRLVYVLKRLYSGSNSNLLMMILVCTVLTIRLILVCDRILGLTNNFGYVIMLSAANDILTVIVLLFVFHVSMRLHTPLLIFTDPLFIIMFKYLFYLGILHSM